MGMHSHSCVNQLAINYTQSVILCGSPTNATMCIRFEKTLYRILKIISDRPYLTTHILENPGNFFGKIINLENYSYNGWQFGFESETQVGHELGAMVSYKLHRDEDFIFPVVIGGKTGNLTTGIAELYARPYWKQFDMFPIRIYG